MSRIPSRGIDYADGGIATLTVHHPDPARIAAINAEWADTQIPDADNGDGEHTPQAKESTST